MNYFDDKKEFLQEQVGTKGKWPTLLSLSKKQRSQMKPKTITNHMSAEQAVLHHFDNEIASLEKRRISLESQLTSTKKKLTKMLSKRKKLVKVLEINTK